MGKSSEELEDSMQDLVANRSRDSDSTESFRAGMAADRKEEDFMAELEKERT